MKKQKVTYDNYALAAKPFNADTCQAILMGATKKKLVGGWTNPFEKY